MKKTVLNYLEVAARLPFAVAGGLLLLAGAVFNTLASVVSHPYSSPNHNLYSPIHLYRAIYIQI